MLSGSKIGTYFALDSGQWNTTQKSSYHEGVFDDVFDNGWTDLKVSTNIQVEKTKNKYFLYIVFLFL